MLRTHRGKENKSRQDELKCHQYLFGPVTLHRFGSPLNFCGLVIVLDISVTWMGAGQGGGGGGEDNGLCLVLVLGLLSPSWLSFRGVEIAEYLRLSRFFLFSFLFSPFFSLSFFLSFFFFFLLLINLLGQVRI